MSIVPEPSSAVAVARQRAVLVVGDDGVEVAEQQQPARARAGQPDEQVGGVIGRGALDALDRRLVGRERGRDRDGLLGGSGTSPLGDEIATSASSSRSARVAMALGVLSDPRIHGSVPFHAMASAPHVGDLAPDFALEGTEGPFRLSDHRGERVVLLFYPGDDTPVCTKQFCSYRDRADDMSALAATVVGISHQDVDSHEAFTATTG